MFLFKKADFFPQIEHRREGFINANARQAVRAQHNVHLCRTQLFERKRRVLEVRVTARAMDHGHAIIRQQIRVARGKVIAVNRQ